MHPIRSHGEITPQDVEDRFQVCVALNAGLEEFVREIEHIAEWREAAFQYARENKRFQDRFAMVVDPDLDPPRYRYASQLGRATPLLSNHCTRLFLAQEWVPAEFLRRAWVYLTRCPVCGGHVYQGGIIASFELSMRDQCEAMCENGHNIIEAVDAIHPRLRSVYTFEQAKDGSINCRYPLVW